jgi:hypothetical protein
MFLKVLIDQYPHLHGPLPTYVSEKQEYELAEQFVRFSIRHLIGTQSHSEILELFHSCQSIGLLPILYDSYQNSLHLASSNPSDDYAAELEEAEQICRKHVERYIKEKRKLFDQPHYWRIHNGLFRFSSNAENYVYYLLDHNPKDLVKLLICFYENKHLDYEGLTSDYEPYKLIEISKKAKQSPIELEGQKQLLGALEKGVDCQQRLDFLPDRIAIYRGHGYKCLKYEGTSRLSNPTDDLVDILRRYNTSDGFDYRRFIERKNFKALLARAEQANVRQELDESDQRLVNKLRQGWKCEQEYRITPHLVKRQGDQFVCYKQAADGNWVAF